MRRGATRVLLGYYIPFCNEEAHHKLQLSEVSHLPTTSISLDRGKSIESVSKIRINTDGSVDLQEYELYPTDGPPLVVTPAGADKLGWSANVARRRAILSGIDVTELDDN